MNQVKNRDTFQRKKIKGFLLDDVESGIIQMTDFEILFFDLDGQLQCWNFLTLTQPICNN